MAYFRLRGCKCSKDKKKEKKRCTCGAKWSYTVDIGIDPVTGKRKQKTKGGFTLKKDAMLEAQEIERQVALNMYVEETNVTFSEFAEEWFDEYRLSIKISTANLRKRQMEILNNKFGALKLTDISRRRYQDTINDFAKHYAVGSVRIIHSTARLIFKRALKYNLIVNDPTEHITIPQRKMTVEELEAGLIPKYLEKEELALFLETVKKTQREQDYTLFYLLSFTGMRIGEAFALKWSDISFEEKTISITKTCYAPDNVKIFEILTPKTKASVREISVDDSVISQLKKHKFRQNKEIQELNKRAEIYKDHNFVFTSYRSPGYPYSKATVELKMKQALGLSKIKTHLYPHSLRHTHTSLLAEAGVELTEIMDRLGHEDDQVTRRIYLHVTKTKKVEAAEKFASLMENVVKL